MIVGAHSIIYSKEPAAHVDVGDGWLIFGLPPAEVAVHPSEANNVHELYLMCKDVGAFLAAMERRKIACSAVQNQGWGLLTKVTLPGGGTLGVYQPRHARPKAADQQDKRAAPPSRKRTSRRKTRIKSRSR